jgi:hypothetical protein
VEAEVVKIEDNKKVTAYDVIMRPALAVDGDVRSVGKVLSPSEIKSLIRNCIPTGLKKWINSKRVAIS